MPVQVENSLNQMVSLRSLVTGGKNGTRAMLKLDR